MEKCWSIPLEAVKVMTTMFPKIEKAMIPDTIRGAKSLPKTSLKNTVAMSRLSYSRLSVEITQSYKDISARMMFPGGERYKGYVDEDIHDGDENNCDDGRLCKSLLWLIDLAHHLRGPGKSAKQKAHIWREWLDLRRKAAHTH